MNEVPRENQALIAIIKDMLHPCQDFLSGIAGTINLAYNYCESTRNDFGRFASNPKGFIRSTQVQNYLYELAEVNRLNPIQRHVSATWSVCELRLRSERLQAPVILHIKHLQRKRNILDQLLKAEYRLDAAQHNLQRRQLELFAESPSTPPKTSAHGLYLVIGYYNPSVQGAFVKDIDFYVPSLNDYICTSLSSTLTQDTILPISDEDTNDISSRLLDLSNLPEPNIQDDIRDELEGDFPELSDEEDKSQENE